MKLKRVLALLLALAMIFALAACGDKKEKEEEEEKGDSLSENIVGTWECELSMTGATLEIPPFDGKLDVKYEFTFKADGTCTAKVDPDAFKATVEENRAGLGEAAVQMLINQAGSRQVAAGMIKAEMNMTLEQYGDYFVDELKASMTGEAEEQEWKVEDGKLTMDEKSYTISIDGDTMTWKGDELKEQFDIDSLTLKRK